MPAALKSLSFTTVAKVAANPVQSRRDRILSRLEDQKALLANPGHTRMVRSWKKKDGDQGGTTTKEKPVRPWWNRGPNGSYVFVVRHGSKPIEFEKGKAGVMVPTMDQLPTIIDTLIAAVQNGELDEHLRPTKKSGTAKTRKTT